MHVLIVTVGSWGDVAPYTGLGVRLAAAGHRVSVATHARFAGQIASHGLGFRPLPVDPREELASARGRSLARAAAPPVAMAHAVRMARTFMPRLAEGITAAVRGGTDGTDGTDGTAGTGGADGADVLLASTLTDPMCSALGEALGIPCLGVYLQPILPTAEFPPLITGAHSYGRTLNRLAGYALWAGADRLFAPAVGTLRRELGLPARRFTGPLGPARDRTVLHGYSPSVVPRPSDWPAGHRVTGYWWPAAPPGWQPEPRLLDFLAAGPPPVLAGFGSFVAPDPERLSALLVRAFRLAGVRGLVQSGWTGLHVTGDDLLTIGDTPHDWLFPRTAAVIHHAGAGTSAAGLRAGVPGVPVPVQLDQHFWAARLHRLGTAPRPLRHQRLTAESLAAAIRGALAIPPQGPRRVAAALAAEDGAARVAEALARLE
ncbi:glycosyltransferase [Streptomyces sp. NPDC089799]|uniref:glycosyltransferase n=1 Tax=Streptomyces sp. NPDC089799 TaxID=3155066 RepID=UPI0034325E6F